MDLRLAAAEVNVKQNLLWKQPGKKKESRLKTAACRCQCQWEAICSCFLHCCSSQIGGTVPRNVYPYAYFDTVYAVWFCYPRPVLSLPASVCVCVCQSVCQSLACLRDYSGQVQARITKFGTKVQNNLVKVPIVRWSNQPWSSRSNLTWKSEFTPFWACHHYNSLPIQARIT